MKIATLINTYNQTHNDVLLLQNMSDFDEFEQLTHDANEDEIVFALKTKVPQSGWDHLFNGGYGCMTVGVTQANVLGGNAIINSVIHMESKLNTIKRLIEHGDTVVVNHRGGYFPVYDSLEIEIVEMKEYIQDKTQYVDIPFDTIIMNLENDLDLEPQAIKYMEKHDPNYSSIRKLRSFSQQDLVLIFTKFKDNGGEVAYIYTTGTDVSQMRTYTRALMVAGINKIRFEFNAGITPEIKEFIESLKLYDIDVELIDQWRI